MPERTLEEQADDLLRAEARRQGCSLRVLGVMDRRRRRVVRIREVPMAALWSGQSSPGQHVYDMTRELPEEERKRMDEP